MVKYCKVLYEAFVSIIIVLGAFFLSRCLPIEGDDKISIGVYSAALGALKNIIENMFINMFCSTIDIHLSTKRYDISNIHNTLSLRESMPSKCYLSITISRKIKALQNKKITVCFPKGVTVCTEEYIDIDEQDSENNLIININSIIDINGYVCVPLDLIMSDTCLEQVSKVSCNIDSIAPFVKCNINEFHIETVRGD